MAADEIIVCQLRIAGQDPINFFQLSWAEIFRGIETPTARQEALPAKDLVQARNAPHETILDIE